MENRSEGEYLPEEWKEFFEKGIKTADEELDDVIYLHTRLDPDDQVLSEDDLRVLAEANEILGKIRAAINKNSAAIATAHNRA